MPRKLSSWFLLLVAGISMLSFVSVGTAAEPVSKSRFGGVAIGGQDTVAYHSLDADPHQASVDGQKSWVVKWKGAKWRFANQESAEQFKNDPEKYSPAYNGFCANALSLGKGLLRTDGTHWELFGDKLYLFYAASGRDRWVDATEISELVAVANKEWQRLSQ